MTTKANDFLSSIYIMLKKLKPLNYNDLSFMDTYCNVNNLFNYHKINFIQAPLEVILSFFVYSGVIMFTTNILSDKTLSIFIVYYLLFPLILAIIICFIYLIFITNYINNTILNYINSTLSHETGFCFNSNHFIKLDIIFEKVFKKIHFSGAICYFIASGVYSLLGLLKSPESNLCSRIPFILFVGFILGAIWNFRGFLGDARIDWYKLFKFDSWSCDYPLLNSNYNNFLSKKVKQTFGHIILNFLSSFIVIGIIVFIVFLSIDNPNIGNNGPSYETILESNYKNIEMNVMIDSDSNSQNELYKEYFSITFYIGSFVYIFFHYNKTLFPLFYMKSGNIYLDIDNLFGRKSE